MSFMSEHYELAMVLTGRDPDNEEQFNDEDGLYEDLFDKYGIEFDAFEALIGDLLPLIEVGKSPLTDKMYKGFGKDGRFLTKIEA